MKRTILITLLISLSFSFTFSQNIGDLKANDTIPFDPTVRYGKLSNGFTYYIKNNSTPANKIAMRFIVKAGALLEDDDQAEMAHLLEHIAFRGTVNFPNGIQDYFEKKGIKRGTDINANTGFEYTKYRFDIPGNDTDLLNNSLMIMKDLSHDIIMRPADVESEKKLVLSELSRSAVHTLNLRNKENALLLKDSKLGVVFSGFINRVPFNDFKIESLNRFYQDWYRPDMQCIIVVGNVDVNAVERKIRSLFSDLTNPKTKRKRKEFPVLLTGKNKFISILDSNEKDIVFKIYQKKPANSLVTLKDYREALMTDLFNNAMKARLDDWSNKYIPKHEGLTIKYDETIISPDIKVAGLVTSIRIRKQAFFDTIVTSVLSELERLARFGISKEELERSKIIILTKHKPISQTPLIDFVDNYERNFVFGYAAPSVEAKQVLEKRLLNEIEVNEINQVIKKWIGNSNRDIFITAPESLKKIIPNEKRMIQLLNKAKTAQVAKYTMPSVPTALISDKELATLSKEAKYQETSLEGIGISKITLANGITILLKPIQTDKPEKRIRLTGIRPGGYSSLSIADHSSAYYASSIIENSGAGGLNKFELTRYLSGKNIQISLAIREKENFVTGSANAGDLELLLQLIYQYLVAPNKNMEAYSNWLSNRKQGGRFVNTNLFYETMRKTLNPVVAVDNGISLDKVDFNKAFNIYKEQFGNSANFVFVLTGDFNTQKIVPLLARYLGNLPISINNKTALTDSIPNVYSVDDKNKIVYSGTDSTRNAEVELRFKANYSYNDTNNFTLRILENSLKFVLTKRLREIEGGTYYVNTETILTRFPSGHFVIGIGFGPTASNVQKMIGFVWEEINKIKVNGPDTATLNKSILLQKTELTKNMNSPEFMNNYISDKVRYQGNINDIMNWTAILNQLSISDIKTAAIQYLAESNFMSFVLLPEIYKPKH